MRLGVGSYTFVWGVGVPGFPPPPQPLTPEQILEKAASLNVHVVQIADNLPLHHLSANRLKDFCRRADDLGLAIEVGTVGIEPANLRRYLEIATLLRSPILRTVIDHGSSRPTPEAAVTQLSPLMSEFEHANVTLALENHDRFEASVLLGIVQRLESKAVGICLDTANSLGAMEGPAHVVETLGARTVNLHIKDVQVSRLPHHKGFIVEGRPAGQGQLDLPALLERLRSFGVEANAILELWPPPLADVVDAIAQEEDWTRQSLTYLRTLIPD